MQEWPQEPPPNDLSHCYKRTLRIVNNEFDGPCTAFVLRYEAQDWLITARHCVLELRVRPDGKPFDLIPREFVVFDKGGNPHPGLDLERLDMVDPRADVTVFRLWSEHLDFGEPLEPYTGDIRATRDVYFLGFPGVDLPQKYGLTASLTTPLLKRAMVSGSAGHYDIRVWLLDGMANHGFSGGPVVTLDPTSKTYQVLGVVNTYVPKNIRTNPEHMRPSPHEVGPAPLKPTDRFFETNSGMTASFSIEHATNDIDKYLHPQSPT